MLSGILSARVLLPQGKGELTTVLLWPTLIAALGNLGIHDALAFCTANDPNNLKKIAASGLLLALLLSLGLMALGYVALPIILSDHSMMVITSSAFFLWYIPLALITAALTGPMLGQLQLAPYNALRTLVHVLNLTGIVALILVSQVSVFGFTAVALISGFIPLVLSAGWAVRKGWLGALPEFDTIKQIISYGLRTHIGSVAGMMNLRLDQLLLSVFLPPSVLGFYVVAVSIGTVGGLGAITVALVAFPYLSRISSFALKREALGRLMRLSLVISLISTGALYLSLNWTINLFFGAEFAESAGPAQLLIFASIPFGCNVVLTAGFKAFGRPATASTAEVVGLGITALSLVILLPPYQALGAAVASLLSYSATFAYLAWQAHRQLQLSLAQLFLPSPGDWDFVHRLWLKMQERLSLS